MSKRKMNPSAIKEAIIAVKHCNLSDSKKDTIITVLKQYQQDKQEGVYSDGMVKQLVFDVAMELIRETEVVPNEVLGNKLLDIVHNMDQRKYYDEEETL